MLKHFLIFFFQFNITKKLSNFQHPVTWTALGDNSALHCKQIVSGNTTGGKEGTLNKQRHLVGVYQLAKAIPR